MRAVTTYGGIASFLSRVAAAAVAATTKLSIAAYSSKQYRILFLSCVAGASAGNAGCSTTKLSIAAARVVVCRHRCRQH